MVYDTKLIDRKIVAEDTMALSFEKPEGYEFQAGQYCFLNMPDKGFNDKRGLRRHLTIASSPLEKELLFAIRITSSAFKKTLKELSKGEIITIEKPLGHFTLPENTSTSLVFIAGGIGITPFRSMIKYASDAHTKHVITLFYSNSTPEVTAFLDELESIADINDNIIIIPTMTKMNSSSMQWDGLTGRINPLMIKDNCKDWNYAAYYIAGPPKMVDGIQEVIKNMHVNKERINIEKLTGY
jgi:ferredoxin-NADP reductase